MASPARSAGVVGLKPTAGLISRHGVYVVNKLQDSVGIFAKTVREAAFVLDVVATRNSSDSERRRTGATVNPLVGRRGDDAAVIQVAHAFKLAT